MTPVSTPTDPVSTGPASIDPAPIDPAPIDPASTDTSLPTPAARTKKPPRSTTRAARSTSGGSGDDGGYGLNLATVVGTVGSEPIRKELPSGSVLVGFSVSVRTSAERPATSLPVVWFDPPAKAAPIVRDAHVVVVGHLARRFFRAGGQTQSRTELVAERVEPVRRKATCRRVLSAAGADLAEFVSDTFA